MMLGAVIASRLEPRRPMVVGMIATAVLALPLLALAVAPIVVVLAPVAVLAGVAVTQFGIVWETALQRHIPPDRLARVVSFDALGSYAAIPLGQIVVGPTADRFGTRPVLLAASVIIAVASFAALASRDVRQLENLSA